MADLAAQHASLAEALERAALEVLRSGRYVLGPQVAALEAELAEDTGTRHGVGVSSGTDALLLALTALGVGPGDLVLTTAFSFAATAEVACRLGARPVFLDIDPGTFNLSPAALARWLEDHPVERARVKALVPVHLFGQLAEMDELLRLAARHGIPVIEDAAQALGASCPERRPAGSFGLAGCLSFYPTKNLGAAGDGGMIVTSDAAFAARLRSLGNHGGRGHAEVGGNFRLDELQAALLRVKRPHLPAWNAARRAHAAAYDAELPPWVGRPAVRWGDAHHARHHYVVTVEAAHRDALMGHLAARGVASEIYYPRPLHLTPAFLHLGGRAGDHPAAEHAAATALALPVFPELRPEQRARVVASVTSFAAS